MKFHLLVLLVIVILYQHSFSQDNNDKGKAYYTTDEVKKMCGIPITNKEEDKRLALIEAKMLKEYRLAKTTEKLLITNTPPDWRTMMSEIELQECNNCWAHAGTGVIEGQLHITLGSNIGIDLDEMEITDYWQGCNGADIFYAFQFVKGIMENPDYLKAHKAGVEWENYPNIEGVRWGISSYQHLTCETSCNTIEEIMELLETGPVTGAFTYYDDFAPFFASNPLGVYRYNGVSPGGDWRHAVVIVSYNEEEEYWICKNSWGSEWGDEGYFRIGFGECRIDTYRNCYVRINQSDFAKIVPQIVNINTALSSTWVKTESFWPINEKAIINAGSYTLTSQPLDIEKNCDVVIKDGANINLNGYTLGVVEDPAGDGEIIFEGTGNIPNSVQLRRISDDKIVRIFPVSYSNINVPSGYYLVIPSGTITQNFTIPAGQTWTVKSGTMVNLLMVFH